MKPRRITSKDVAERAGVSQTTVSFVLNGRERSGISEQTRQRVQDAARELNYVPHIAARQLARGDSRNIALVLVKPHQQVFTDPYVPNILTGLNRVAQKYGYHILVEQINSPSQRRTLSNLLRGGQVEGALVSGWNAEEQELIDLFNEGYPIVRTDQSYPDERGLPYVAIDHHSGVKAAAEHLIKLGHQRIACIAYAPYTPPDGVPRMEHAEVNRRVISFRQTLEAAGLFLDSRMMRAAVFDPETGYAAAQSLLDEAEPPTAIFGMNDLMALGAIAAIHGRGLRVPQDIAVMGYDDMRFASFMTPALTTVRTPEIELGAASGELLVALLQKDTPPASSLLMTQLIVRDSCGATVQA
jgi:LacI family transcriptional regulator